MEYMVNNFSVIISVIFGSYNICIFIRVFVIDCMWIVFVGRGVWCLFMLLYFICYYLLVVLMLWLFLFKIIYNKL